VTNWQAAIDALIGARSGRIMVLGERDVGKSAFCEQLLRQSAAERTAAVLVDADVGQKIVGPPACVTLGRFDEAGRAECLALAFVGTVSPVRGWRKLMDAVERLCRSRDRLLVVNTDGLLSGPGLRQKTEMIGRCGIDRLLMISNSPDLDQIAEAHPAVPALRLPRSAGAVRKTEAVRRINRRGAFQSYFHRADERVLDLASEQVEGDLGRLSAPRLLVGLTDRQGQDIAMGIVTRHDPVSGSTTVLTPAAQADPHGIRLGMMQVDENFDGKLIPTGAQPEPLRRLGKAPS
jgi:polynucleotide 5'-hydroxyl-kinase GRC3/NOL9